MLECPFDCGKHVLRPVSVEILWGDWPHGTTPCPVPGPHRTWLDQSKSGLLLVLGLRVALQPRREDGGLQMMQ